MKKKSKPEVAQVTQVIVAVRHKGRLTDEAVDERIRKAVRAEFSSSSVAIEWATAVMRA